MTTDIPDDCKSPTPTRRMTTNPPVSQPNRVVPAPERIWINPRQAWLYAKCEQLRDPFDTEQYVRTSPDSIREKAQRAVARIAYEACYVPNEDLVADIIAAEFGGEK